jgi:hypothetical protein
MTTHKLEGIASADHLVRLRHEGGMFKRFKTDERKAMDDPDDG